MGKQLKYRIPVLASIILILFFNIVVAQYNPVDRYRPLLGGIQVETGRWVKKCFFIWCWYEWHDAAYSTLSYVAYRNGVYGYVIAGHAINFQSGYYIYQPTNDGNGPGTGNNLIGGPYYFHATGCDAAFVPADLSILTPRVLSPNKKLLVLSYKGYYSAPLGVFLYKMGRTTQFTNGTLVQRLYQITVTAPDYSYVVYYVFRTTVYIQPGDSGSPVYRILDSGYYNYAELYGHVSAGDGTYSYVVSITSVAIYLDVSPMLGGGI